MNISLTSSNIIVEILPKFLQKYGNGPPPMEPKFARNLLLLLLRYNSLKLTSACSVSKLEEFLKQTVERCTNGVDATICHLRLIFHFRRANLMHLANVEEKYFKNHEKRANILLHSVLQYPQNCSEEQLEEMMLKLQIFIISNHHLGCPKDSLVRLLLIILNF